MSSQIRRPGQPIVALALLLAGWVGVRAVMLEAVHPVAQKKTLAVADNQTAFQKADQSKSIAPVREFSPSQLMQPPPIWNTSPELTPIVPRPLLQANDFAPVPLFSPLVENSASQPVTETAIQQDLAAPITESPPNKLALSSGHLMLWMAGVSHIPMPFSSEKTAPPATADPLRQSRWSGDSWMMLRRGGNLIVANGPQPGTYGASQIGAVIRYRLAESSARPSVYLRGSAAVGQIKQKELAAGLSLRPLGSLPISLAAELRLQDAGNQTRARPGVMMVTELPPFALPAGLRGEAYAQAGYVGAKGATAFADGQLRIDKAALQWGKKEIRIGGAVLGGAQKGAARLDIGPGATLALPINHAANARLALDWRFRIAGTALPKSGPALTLSAGF